MLFCPKTEIRLHINRNKRKKFMLHIKESSGNDDTLVFLD